MATKSKLVFFEKWVSPVAERMLKPQSNIDLIMLKYSRPEAENWSELATAHGYQVQARTELKAPWFGNGELLKRCPGLVALSSTGAGHDVIDVGACDAAGVIVVNQSGSNREAVAQHTLGLMICLSKKISLADRMMRRSSVPAERYALAGNDLTNRTVGIVGIGHIGTRVAELCGGLFGMTVLAYDPFLSSDQIAARGAKKTNLVELLERSDFVTLHCPRSAETLDMFGTEEFKLMKRSAFFINTARGGIHNEEELAQAIARAYIAGAGIDVFLQEPTPYDHPLLQFDNVVVTPHNAGITHEALEMMASSAASQWIDVFSGKVPPRLVNPQAWSRYSARFKEIFGSTPAQLPQ
ncbi:hydroxyacid dehydrogenase [Pseudorhodoplanes sinuspersici]|uniref:Uncharacterized protein n=1 Tax=Pseudorhodoplanes sinuspersici TaxID=1235591 RepID=A0A1W6ZLM7_9HYPH|nr:hydroxyacid dehydrogenase [Pseudorhodoplanes sinuspersici]ARP98020.1 hypothetical protein CAK95_02195 [Pseudorhodoplanes sinuspersici]RKE68224.1 D-3-phosphoglycerate dehydrogenase [Pseudorhodoplanes sinuspersici]